MIAPSILFNEFLPMSVVSSIYFIIVGREVSTGVNQDIYLPEKERRYALLFNFSHPSQVSFPYI